MTADAHALDLRRPDLVLRVAFAGGRKLPEEKLAALQESLTAVYGTIMQQLREELARRQTPDGSSASITQFYSARPPLLRLVSGLAEGADALASEVLLQQANDEHQRFELAGVLPFDRQSYRQGRHEAFRPQFDRLVAQCRYVLELDGIYDKPEPDTSLAKQRRARAYRGQGNVLLRHADMLLAIADASAAGRAGGTLETIDSALALEMPVVLIDSASARVAFLEPEDDWRNEIAGPPITASGITASGITASGITASGDTASGDTASGDTASGDTASGDTASATAVDTTSAINRDTPWQSRFRHWITDLVAAPDVEPFAVKAARLRPQHDEAAGALLRDYFDSRQSIPPRGKRGVRRRGLRDSCWALFVYCFRPRSGPAIVEQPLEPYHTYRRRATELNYHYSGLYRGTFLLNYAFAVIAVALSAFGLLLLGQEHSSSVNEIRQALQVSSTQVPSAQQAVNPPESPAELGGNDLQQAVARTIGEEHLGKVLLLLAVMKLGLVYLIYRNTHQSNSLNWNQKAIDCRYLAERLRAAYYLPAIGSFRWPGASPPQFATRALQQSSIDWLVNAIMRSVSPAEVSAANAVTEPCPGESRGLRSDPQEMLDRIRRQWLQGQIQYHATNASTMNRLSMLTERLGRWLSMCVVLIVALDVLILLLVILGWQSPAGPLFNHLTPYLVFASAVLPVIVAGLNGLHFQSECRRLSERSLVIKQLLHRSDQKTAELSQRIQAQTQSPENNLGCWTPEVLRIAEAIARNFAEEVTEWSVVYTKRIPEE